MTSSSHRRRGSSTSANSSRKVDLVHLLAQNFHCKSYAALCMISHGQVYIDGHCVRPQWRRHWTQEQLHGRMLKCPAGEARIFGSRLIRDYEQMRLA
jgi:hypothetical protein